MDSAKVETAAPKTIWNEISDLLESEPGIAWFASQLIYIGSPALEVFLPRERIERYAERLETGGRPADAPAKKTGLD
jgi:hypothetical protein